MNLFFIIILFIACLTGASTDIYAPSLAAIATEMHAPISLAQVSMSIFMVGLAPSQLIYGPLSEAYGRRLPMIIGLSIFIFASLLCMLTTNIEILILGRFLQGLGAGAGAALWRAIFRDVYQGAELAKYGAYLSIIIVFIIPAVPVLGGYLQHYLGWQASFAVLLLWSITTLIMILTSFNETSQHHHRDRLHPKFIAQTFTQLLTSRIFMGYSLCVFFCYGAFFSWFAVGPVLLVKTVGLNPVQFGWTIFLIGASAMGLASTLNGRLVGRLGSPFLLRFGFSTMLLAGLLLLAGHALLGVHLYAIIFPVFLFIFGVTFVWPNAFAGAFTPFGKIAGYVGALYSFMQLGGGAVIGTLAAHLPATSALPLAIIFIIAPILSWLTYEVMINRIASQHAS